MQIQINSDSSVRIDHDLSLSIQADVQRVLLRFERQVTRVEVHLSGAGGEWSGRPDKRCLLEARPAGQNPVSVSDEADTVERAAQGAAEKMNRLLTSQFARQEAKS